MEKIIVFGLGNEYRNYVKRINERYIVIGYMDNYYKFDDEEINKLYIRIDELDKYNYDKILICTSKYDKEIKKQLINMKVSEDKLLYLDSLTCSYDFLYNMHPDYRYDFFLIWGNGISYFDNIIRMINDDTRVEIVYIEKKYIDDMRSFVEMVYSYDYAPWNHLIDKTQYLMNTPKEVCFVFVKNKEPDEIWLGDGPFRHIESQTIRSIKDRIREKFNEKIEGIMTYNHVVHASDNEFQTQKILYDLEYSDTTDIFKKQGILQTPKHINFSNNFRIYRIGSTAMLYAGNLVDDKVEILPLSETVQYRAITQDMNIYIQYLAKYQGWFLKDFYSVDKYRDLFANFDLDKYCEVENMIVVRKIDDKLVIQDGVHRASIMLYKNIKDVLIAEEI